MNIMIARFLYTLLFLNLMSFANLYAKDSSFDSLYIQIQTLKQQIKQCDDNINWQKNQLNLVIEQLAYQKEQINNQTGMIDTVFDGISTETAAVSNTLAIFGIVFGLFGILLGVYLTYLFDKMQKIFASITILKQDNENLLKDTVQVKGGAEKLIDEIRNDIVNLYKRIKNEESTHIVNRLIEVPEDIVNVAGTLLSRELDKSYYPKLKEAFLQIRHNVEYNGPYISLFFQHFVDMFVLDNEIKSELFKYFVSVIDASFKNDIDKSTKDYFTALLNNGLSKSEVEINNFAKSVSMSKYANYEGLYFSIFHAISSRDDRFFIYKMIEKGKETIVFRKEYGKLLFEYKEQDLTQEETDIISEVEQLNQVI